MVTPEHVQMSFAGSSEEPARDYGLCPIGVNSSLRGSLSVKGKRDKLESRYMDKTKKSDHNKRLQDKKKSCLRIRARDEKRDYDECEGKPIHRCDFSPREYARQMARKRRQARLRLANRFLMGEKIKGEEWACVDKRFSRAANADTVKRYAVNMLFAAAGYESVGVPPGQARNMLGPALSSVTDVPRWMWGLDILHCIGDVYTEVARNEGMEEKQLLKNLHFRYNALPVVELTSAKATAMRMLLLMAGIEPNPGPAVEDAAAEVPKGQTMEAKADRKGRPDWEEEELEEMKWNLEELYGITFSRETVEHYYEHDMELKLSDKEAREAWAMVKPNETYPGRDEVNNEHFLQALAKAYADRCEEIEEAAKGEEKVRKKVEQAQKWAAEEKEVKEGRQRPGKDKADRKREKKEQREKKKLKGATNTCAEKLDDRMKAFALPERTPKYKSGGRSHKRESAYKEAAIDMSAREAGTRDALHEMAQVNAEQLRVVEAGRIREGELLDEIQNLRAEVTEARDRGFVFRDGQPQRVYCFHGRFIKGFYSSFHNGRSSSGTPDRTETCDPVVCVNVYADGTWSTDAGGSIFYFRVSDHMLQVAARTVKCCSMEARMSNIYNGIQTCQEIKEDIRQLQGPQLVDYMYSVELIAFVLTGLISASGKLRWLNDCDEWVLEKYEITELPPDAESRLSEVHFASDSMKFQARTARQGRAGFAVIENLAPCVPNPAHMNTLKAGMLKRMYPKLPKRSEATLNSLRAKANDLSQYIVEHARVVYAEHPERELTQEQILEKALKGRNVYEARQIIAGWERAREDPEGTIDWYCTLPYKCFIKLESYPEGSMKPPRFIQSMDPEARGVQLYFMGSILHRIEVGTLECNVKGLTPDQITDKLKRKFAHTKFAAESDFGAFEASIGPDLKSVCENLVFETLATTADQTTFIRRALGRQTVNVIGPCFTIPHYHHIRMSGDLWTSIGNLLTNIVVSAFCNEWTIPHIIAVGLFEGDDGVYPAPRNLRRVLERATAAGVILELNIAPWEALSFCGNHFAMLEDGTVIRFRDPVKAATNATILFSAPSGTRKYDIMLQRSKVICYLQYPIIPDAYVFFTVFERFTRDFPVEEAIMMKWGLLKEYSGHGVERCVPDYLVFNKHGSLLTDDEFVNMVFARNCHAGGQCPKSTIWAMVNKLKDAIEHRDSMSHVVLPNPFARENRTTWFARDGARYTHLERNLLIPSTRVNNVQQSIIDGEAGETRLMTHHSLCPGLTWRFEHDKKGERPTMYYHFSDFIPLLMVMGCVLMSALFCWGIWTSHIERVRYLNSQSYTSVNPLTNLPYSADAEWPMCVFEFERYEPVSPPPEPPPFSTHWSWEHVQLLARLSTHYPLDTLPGHLEYAFQYGRVVLAKLLPLCGGLITHHISQALTFLRTPLRAYSYQVLEFPVVMMHYWLYAEDHEYDYSTLLILHALYHLGCILLPLIVSWVFVWLLRFLPGRILRVMRRICYWTMFWYFGFLPHLLFFLVPLAPLCALIVVAYIVARVRG